MIFITIYLQFYFEIENCGEEVQRIKLTISNRKLTEIILNLIIKHILILSKIGTKIEIFLFSNKMVLCFQRVDLHNKATLPFKIMPIDV